MGGESGDESVSKYGGGLQVEKLNYVHISIVSPYVIADNGLKTVFAPGVRSTA